MSALKMRFRPRILDWQSCGILTISDASFSNEAGYKGQQGRSDFLVNARDLKDATSTVFSCRRFLLAAHVASMNVRRPKLQPESYSFKGTLKQEIAFEL